MGDFKSELGEGAFPFLPTLLCLTWTRSKAHAPYSLKKVHRKFHLALDGHGNEQTNLACNKNDAFYSVRADAGSTYSHVHCRACSLPPPLALDCWSLSRLLGLVLRQRSRLELHLWERFSTKFSCRGERGEGGARAPARRAARPTPRRAHPPPRPPPDRGKLWPYVPSLDRLTYLIPT